MNKCRGQWQRSKRMDCRWGAGPDGVGQKRLLAQWSPLSPECQGRSSHAHFRNFRKEWVGSSAAWKHQHTCRVSREGLFWEVTPLHTICLPGSYVYLLRLHPEPPPLQFSQQSLQFVVFASTQQLHGGCPCLLTDLSLNQHGVTVGKGAFTLVCTGPLILQSFLPGYHDPSPVHYCLMEWPRTHLSPWKFGMTIKLLGCQ